MPRLLLMDEVEKLAYQLNEEAEWTERPIRRLISVAYILHMSLRIGDLLNSHKNTSLPNNPLKCSICLSIYHKTHSHGKKSNRKILFTTFLKEKETEVKDS
ncbi:UNVERIFIED_CONTAM: hypothetical protein NCL1_17192 [Trichonephila clavipes]